MNGSPFGVVYLAVDDPRGDPAQCEQGLNSPGPTYTSPRTPTDT